MGTTLTGNKVKDTYKSLIKITDSTEAGSSAKQLSDGNGNDLGLYVDTDGVFGIGAPANVSLDISSATDAIGLPVGTTANRPTGSAGQMRYNSTTGDFELYDTGWTEIFTTDGGTVSGDVTITGDLIVQGTTVTLNTETIEFEDSILQLNTTQGSPDTATGVVSGISIYRGDGVTQASFLFDDADDTWDLTNNLVVDGNLTVDAITGATVNVEGDFAVNTNDLFVKSTSSYVALGHTAPLYPLHIINSNGNIFKASSSDTIVNMFLENNTQRVDLYSNRGSAAIQVDQNDESGAYDSTFAITIDNNSYFKIHTDGKVEVQDGDFVVDTNTLYVDSANNRVGIGTDSPSAKLDIRTTSDQAIYAYTDGGYNALEFTSDSGTTTGSLLAYSGTIRIGNASGVGGWLNGLVIDGSGNVGIGTDSPVSYLEVETSGSSGSEDIAVFSRAAFGEVLKISRAAGHAELNANLNLTLSADYNNTQTAGNSNLIFKTDGTERMRIDAVGDISFRDTSANEAFYWDASTARLGLGTTSPATNLHISSAASIPIARIESTHPSGIPFLDLKGAASSQIRYLDETGTVQTRIDMSDGGGFSFVDVAGSGSARMTIDSSGFVTIGRLEIPNVNATNEIQLTGTEYSNIYSQTTSGFDIGTNSSSGSSYLRLLTENSERMRIDSSGNVGINQTNPLSKLHITNDSGGSGGYLKVTDAVYNGDVRFGMADGVDNDAHFGTWTNNNIVAFTNSTERMRIDSSGRILMGVTDGAGSIKLTVGDGTNPRLEITPVTDAMQLEILNDARNLSKPLKIYAEETVFHSRNHPAGYAEAVRIDTSGRVGLGTDSPNTILDVRDTDALIRVAATNASGEATFELRGVGSNGTSNAISRLISTPESTGTASALRFETRNSSGTIAEKMRIDSSGRVGIGESNPTRLLHLSGSGGGAIVNIERTDVASGGGGLGGLQFLNSDGNTMASVTASAESSNTTSYLSFRTTAAASTENPFAGATERMRITSGGEVLIGGTTDNGAYNLQVNGTGVWGAGAYVNGSDERLKEDIKPLESAINVVDKIKPVTYKYKESYSKDQSVQTGFIAQELLEVLDGQIYKDGIVKNDGEYMNVAYQNIIALLVKSTQELKAEIETLKSQINN